MKHNRIISTALMTALLTVLSTTAAMAAPGQPNIVLIMAGAVRYN